MPVQEKLARPRCERCQRPVSHCLCAHVSVIDNQTRVLILQHPDEAKHPLNTARLAVLGLRHANLLVGETFPELDDWLALSDNAVLLFPAKDDSALKKSKETPVSEEVSRGLPACAPQQGPPAQTQTPTKAPLLIVPDGTWRKARQIVNANAALQALPRLNLNSVEPSEYIVRKANEPHALSTIEAIVHALGMLEPEQDFRPLLKPFHALVEQQIQAMGPEVFQRNYVGK